MTDHSEDIKPDATKLALERTFLAYERTLMAWTRTSVSLISFGFTLFKFFQYMVEQNLKNMLMIFWDQEQLVS